jgi:hypothetical protein
MRYHEMHRAVSGFSLTHTSLFSPTLLSFLYWHRPPFSTDPVLYLLSRIPPRRFFLLDALPLREIMVKLLSFALLAIPTLVAAADNCSLFSINGSTTAHFEYYRFYDFRNITGGYSNASNASLTFPKALSVMDGSYQNDWTVRVQNKAPPRDETTQLNYTADNVFIGRKMQEHV